MMTDAGWLARLPVIGSLPPAEAAAKLREVGEDDLADAVDAAPQAAPATYGVLSRIGIGGDRAWLHTAHAVGFLAPAAGPGSGLLPIRHAASITPDHGLKGAPGQGHSGRGAGGGLPGAGDAPDLVRFRRPEPDRSGC